MGSIESRLARSKELTRTGARFGADISKMDVLRDVVDEERLSSLKTRESKAQRSSQLNEGNIKEIVELADRKGVVERLLAESKKRIHHHNTALRDSEEIARFGYTEMEGGKLVLDTIKEEWGGLVYAHGEPVAGKYTHAQEPSERIIQIAYQYPTAEQTLTSLANEGRLTLGDQVADHERLHAIQFNQGAADIPPELLEAQAYRIHPVSHTEMPHARLVNHIISSQAYPALDGRKFNSALWSIDRLSPFYTPTEVVDIISNPGTWDERQGVWSRVDAHIGDVMRQRRLNTKALDGRVIMNDLEKQIVRAEARAITQQVLGEAYLDDFVNISKETTPLQIKKQGRHRQDPIRIFSSSNVKQ